MKLIHVLKTVKNGILISFTDIYIYFFSHPGKQTMIQRRHYKLWIIWSVDSTAEIYSIQGTILSNYNCSKINPCVLHKLHQRIETICLL